VQRFGLSRGCETHVATLSFQPESSRSGGGGNETVKAFGEKGRSGDSASSQAVT
jgi:hypothetical protein